jgi:hypothetical protein
MVPQPAACCLQKLTALDLSKLLRVCGRGITFNVLGLCVLVLCSPP